MDHFSFCSHIHSQSLEKPQYLHCLMDELASEQAGLGGRPRPEGRRLREDRPSGRRVSRAGGRILPRAEG